MSNLHLYSSIAGFVAGSLVFFWYCIIELRRQNKDTTLEPGTYTLQKHPIGECSHELGLNDDDEIEALRKVLQTAEDDLAEVSRNMACLEKWYEEFEDLSEWMYTQGLWKSVDVNDSDPMLTYKTGLTRFLKEHNISIK